MMAQGDVIKILEKTGKEMTAMDVSEASNVNYASASRSLRKLRKSGEINFNHRLMHNKGQLRLVYFYSIKKKEDKFYISPLWLKKKIK